MNNEWVKELECGPGKCPNGTEMQWHVLLCCLNVFGNVVMQFCEETTFFGKFDFLIIFPSHNQGTNPPRAPRAQKANLDLAFSRIDSAGSKMGGVFEVSAAHSTNEKNFVFAP